MAEYVSTFYPLVWHGVVLIPADVFILQRTRKVHHLEGTRCARSEGYSHVAEQWHHRGSPMSTLFRMTQLVRLSEL